jgi:dynein heavy chain
LVPGENFDSVKYEEPIRHMLFIFSLVWGFGGSLMEASRVKFDEFLKRLIDLSVVSSPDHEAGIKIMCVCVFMFVLGPNQLPGQLPTLFDFYFDVEKRWWRSWEARVWPS